MIELLAGIAVTAALLAVVWFFFDRSREPTGEAIVNGKKFRGNEVYIDENVVTVDGVEHPVGDADCPECGEPMRYGSGLFDPQTGRPVTAVHRICQNGHRRPDHRWAAADRHQITVPIKLSDSHTVEISKSFVAPDPRSDFEGYTRARDAAFAAAVEEALSIKDSDES